MSLPRLLEYFKSHSFKINLVLGEFTLPKQLGQGGNGIVYEAMINEKEVAIKFLVTDSTGNTRGKKIQRFLAEYFNIITIKENSYVVRYIDYDLLVFEDAYGELEIPVIIMKKYDCSLAKQQKNKSQEEFLYLFKFLLSSIQQIHDEGIIHRDIKPENILVDAKEFVLADFGIASYNPEIFKILANTERKERLGNRLFSAPEQEEPDVSPHPTMDIYALGQVLQWYVTGSTHRGTGRKSITTEFPELTIHDRIIDRCLEQNPNKRFQSIKEINEYLESGKNKDIFNYLYLFNKICRMSFPRNDYNTLHCDDKNKIDRLLANFKEVKKDFDNTLWWVDGNGSFDQFDFDQKGNGIWKLEDSEYDITNVWVHYDASVLNDFVLARYQAGQPFEFEGTKLFHTVIVDGKYTIPYSEYANGFAELEGNIVDLSTQKVEFIERQEKSGFFIIGTTYTCVIQYQNEEEIRSLFDRLLVENRLPDIEEIKEFERKTRKTKHEEVRMRL